jgi:hypothetical protein
MMGVSVFLVVLFLVLFLYGGCSYWRSTTWTKPRREFLDLLAGGNEVHITSVVLGGDGDRVTLSDPALMKYLTDAFRLAVRYRPEGGGVTYDVHISLSSGGSVYCEMYAGEKPGTFYITEPIDTVGQNDPFDEFLIELPQPIPDRLQRLFPVLP